MTKYHCIFRESEELCWASTAPWDSEAQARSHATYFSFELIGLFAVKTGICPPVGMRADKASHCWFFSPLRGWELVPRPKTALEIQQEYHSDPDGDLDGYDGA